MKANKYPYGHPFWLYDDPPVLETDPYQRSLQLLDMFQGGHVFMNPWKNCSCHCDSYGTVFDYANFDRAFQIINDACHVTPALWQEFAEGWIGHTNRQPMTKLLGLSILRKIGVPAPEPTKS